VTGAADALVEVHLLQLPVPVWAKAQEQTAELQREMTLIAETLRGEAEVAEPAAEPRHLPLRLISLIDSLTADFAGVSMRQDQELEDAASAGGPSSTTSPSRFLRQRRRRHASWGRCSTRPTNTAAAVSTS
jgi:hypothetical protein